MATDRKLPHFAFYATDFLASTLDLSNAEVGAYIRLLSMQWDRGTIGAREIASVARGDGDDVGATERVVEMKFSRVVDGYQNARLERERRRAVERYDAQSSAGKRGAARRWNRDPIGDPNSSAPNGDPNSNQNQNQSQTKETQRAPNPADSRFSRFWEVVHRKTGKNDARKAFTRALKRIRDERGGTLDDAATFVTERMRAFAASPDARDEVRGLLHPATWLNQGRYDDEPETWEGRPTAPPAPPKPPREITVDNMRYDLVKKHGLHEAREWSDQRVRKEWESRNVN